MNFDTGFRYGYLHGRGHEQLESERIAALMNHRPAPNPPELIAPTKCKVLRPFFVGGKQTEIDAEITLQRFDAISLAALGKVELVK